MFVCLLIFNYIRLQLFPIAEGKSGPQIVELLTKRVTALGGVQSGTFIVDCETYSSNAILGNITFFSFFLIWLRV